MEDSSAQQYQKIKNRLFVFNLIFDFIILIVFFKSGLSTAFGQLAAQISVNKIILNAVYLILFCVSMYIIHFPLSFYSGYSLEHRFNLSQQTFGQWFSDDIKKNILGLILLLIAIEVIYIFLGVYPDTWWIGAGIFWLLLTFVLAKLTPNVIIPLFYKYGDVKNSELKEKIMQLFKNCKVKLKDIYSLNMSSKTKKANAFVCGMGNNRRVVLGDTLISEFSDDEIEVVVAHELGHYKHRDMLKLLFVNSLTTFIGLYLIHIFLIGALRKTDLLAIDDITFFPIVLLAFMIYGLITMPFLNGFSRFIERAADRFSIEQTNKPQDFITCMEKLAEMNLAEKKPSRLVEIFLYDHPPIYKRIAFAQNYLK